MAAGSIKRGGRRFRGQLPQASRRRKPMGGHTPCCPGLARAVEPHRGRLVGDGTPTWCTASRDSVTERGSHRKIFEPAPEFWRTWPACSAACRRTCPPSTPDRDAAAHGDAGMPGMPVPVAISAMRAGRPWARNSRTPPSPGRPVDPCLLQEGADRGERSRPRSEPRHGRVELPTCVAAGSPLSPQRTFSTRGMPQPTTAVSGAPYPVCSVWFGRHYPGRSLCIRPAFGRWPVLPRSAPPLS